MQVILSEVLSEVKRNYLEEVQRTLHFLRQQRRWTIRHLVLYGGGATIKNMDQILQDKFQLSVSRWGMPSRPDA